MKYVMVLTIVSRKELTATGIAPDFHRTSLLMAHQRQPNQQQM
jgi:hypothetical protein